ncbi:MAG: sulfatase-like hydrolase/transferase [Gimesia sp.]|nr:sulfatase-like hydrolase/transferase [Gimesia sp.]
MKKAFVVSFEQLPACMLGCYGHQWIETPNFDRLASISVLFDQHFANELCTTQNSFPWWTSQTIPKAYEAAEQTSDSFIPHLKKKGIHSTLLLESESETGRHSSVRAQESFFREFDQVETVSGLNGFQVNDDKTPIARLMQTAIDRLPEWMESSKDQLVWIRSEGVPLEPLAPEFFSTLYLDEVLDQGAEEDESSDEADIREEQFHNADTEDADTEQPEPNEETDPVAEDWQELIKAVSELFLNPEEWSELDDQERLMARAVYAGYVTLLDHWLGRFLDTLLEYAETQPVLLVVTAARGGNELLGPARNIENWGLFDETSHVPLFIYDSKNRDQGNRRQFLSQSADIPVSLSSWLETPLETGSRSGNNLLDVISDQNSPVEPMIYAASDHAFALRTSEFYYLESRNQIMASEIEEHELMNEELQAQLYQKPSDRWDVYELHTQLPEVVAQFSALLDEKRTKHHDENLS